MSITSQEAWERRSTLFAKAKKLSSKGDRFREAATTFWESARTCSDNIENLLKQLLKYTPYTEGNTSWVSVENYRLRSVSHLFSRMSELFRNIGDQHYNRAQFFWEKANLIRYDADVRFAEAIIAIHGNIKIEWRLDSRYQHCILETGEHFSADLEQLDTHRR